MVIITKKENYIFELNQDGKVEYKGIKIITSDAEPIMMGRDTSKAFWQEQYRTKITKIETKNYITTSKNAIEEWDVSKNKNKSVIAWIESDGNEGYVLYIAANGIIKLSNTVDFFMNFMEASIINISNFNTSDNTNLRRMFGGCTKVEKLDLRNFDTSKVTAMYQTFNGCSNLKELNVSSFNTASVKEMNCTFGGCKMLKELNVRNFDTSNVENMEYMFSECNSLEKLDVTNFNTSKCTKMIDLFKNCNNLKKLDLHNFNTTNVNNMN